jgi:hypothetical protein
MNMPGFTADASLFQAVVCYRSGGSSNQRTGVRPAWIFGDPAMQLSWRPNSIQDFPGTLTITGDNFPPNVDLILTISNCSEGGIPCRAEAHTSSGVTVGRFFFPGGTFSTAVSVLCGGGTIVTAKDSITGESAQATSNIDC